MVTVIVLLGGVLSLLAIAMFKPAWLPAAMLVRPASCWAARWCRCAQEASA